MVPKRPFFLSKLIVSMLVMAVTMSVRMTVAMMAVTVEVMFVVIEVSVAAGHAEREAQDKSPGSHPLNLSRQGICSCCSDNSLQFV